LQLRSIKMGKEVFMPAPYSHDLRIRVIQLCDAGSHSPAQIAVLFQVSSAWIRRLRQRRRTTGSIAARPWNGGVKPLLDAAQQQRLLQLVRADPDATLAELQQRLHIPVSLSTLSRTLAGRRWTRKKKTLHAAEQDDDERVAQQRAAWQEQMADRDLDHLVFIDESGAHGSMTRRYGRAPAGERVHDAVPAKHWQITTMIAALRTDGLTAPFVFDGATDAAAFETYVEKVLAPQLRPGDCVVMDNLAAHKAAGIVPAITRAGATVAYLPPYSPDFNPIEPMWSKVKGWLRKLKARTTDAVYEAIAYALRQVTTADCQGFIHGYGYG
jgi:transposase